MRRRDGGGFRATFKFVLWQEFVRYIAYRCILAAVLWDIDAEIQTSTAGNNDRLHLRTFRTPGRRPPMDRRRRSCRLGCPANARSRNKSPPWSRRLGFCCVPPRCFQSCRSRSNWRCGRAEHLQWMRAICEPCRSMWWGFDPTAQSPMVTSISLPI